MSGHDPGPSAQPSRGRTRAGYGVLVLLLVGLSVLRLWKLEIDPPRTIVAGYTGQAHYRDEAAKAHEARNKAKWDQWSLSEHDEYGFWRAQSPAWVYGETLWFRSFGVGVFQARMFVVVHTIVALALLMWLAMVRHGLPAAVSVGLILGLNWSYLVYSRLALMEGALICWLIVATVMLSQLQRQPQRAGLWSMLATVAMLVACTIKQTGLLVVPAFAVTLALLGLQAAGTVANIQDEGEPWRTRLLARLRQREAQVALISVGTLAVALAMLVFNPEYQQRLAFNAAHFTVAREESVWVRAAQTLARGLFSFRIQLMFMRLAPMILWLATLELARLLYLENRRQRAAKAGRPEPVRVGALEGRPDPIDLWMLAWAIFALLANLASPHRAIRFQLVLLPPAAWLAASLVARIWRHEWPKAWLGRATQAGLVVLALLGTTITMRTFASWTTTRGASFVWAADELEQLIGERDAVVVGEFAAQVVLETDYRHFYVRPDQFNESPEILEALGITHVLIRPGGEDFVWRLLEKQAPQLLLGRHRLGHVRFRRINLELWALATPERRAQLEQIEIDKAMQKKRADKRKARLKQEAKARHGRYQRQARACLPEGYEPPEKLYTELAEAKPKPQRAKPASGSLPRPPR